MFTDSHAHLTYDPLFGDIENILKRAKNAKVDHIFNICTDLKTAERGLELSLLYSNIKNIGATTPHDVEKEGEEMFPFFSKLAKEGKLVAVGETGLDYYYEHSDKALQKKYLIAYMHLALEAKLPLVIHCRDAFEDLFEIADAEYEGAPLLMHCFTGNREIAKKCLDRGWFLSYSGIVTFKKSTDLQDAAIYTPLDRMLIETDSPYLAPQSKRGKTNEPAFLVETAEKLSILKGVPLADLASMTTQNALGFFNQ